MIGQAIPSSMHMLAQTHTYVQVHTHRVKKLI